MIRVPLVLICDAHPAEELAEFRLHSQQNRDHTGHINCVMFLNRQ
jgi:hypothetical protein